MELLEKLYCCVFQSLHVYFKFTFPLEVLRTTGQDKLTTGVHGGSLLTRLSPESQTPAFCMDLPLVSSLEAPAPPLPPVLEHREPPPMGRVPPSPAPAPPAGEMHHLLEWSLCSSLSPGDASVIEWTPGRE